MNTSTRDTKAAQVPKTAMSETKWRRFLELTAAGVPRKEAEEDVGMTSYKIQTFLIQHPKSRDEYDQARLEWLRRDMDYQVIEDICMEVATGTTMAKACDVRFVPIQQFYRWILKDPICKEMYDEARTIQAEFMMDEMMEVADDDSKDHFVDDDGVKRPNNAAVTRARVRLEQRRWQVAKMVPRRFSEKTFSEEEVNVNVNQVNSLDAARRRLEALNKKRMATGSIDTKEKENG